MFLPEEHATMRAPQIRKAMLATGPERLLQAKLPADLVKALRIHALEQETTVKELLTQIVRDYLARQRPRAEGTRRGRQK
jgi:hypothetical protein